jgi:hypothetical protein
LLTTRRFLAQLEKRFPWREPTGILVGAGVENHERNICSCDEAGWKTKAELSLKNGFDVELLNFDFEQHGRFCESLANNYGVELWHDRDAARNPAHLKRRPQFDLPDDL